MTVCIRRGTTFHFPQGGNEGLSDCLTTSYALFIQNLRPYKVVKGVREYISDPMRLICSGCLTVYFIFMLIYRWSENFYTRKLIILLKVTAVQQEPRIDSGPIVGLSIPKKSLLTIRAIRGALTLKVNASTS